MKTRAVAVALVLSASVSLVAQENLDPSEVHVVTGIYTPPTGFILRTDSRLVEIGAVVRDRQGHPAAGLTQNDFQILDEGKARQISLFSVLQGPPAAAPASSARVPAAPWAPSAPQSEAAPPRSIALFFDDINSRPGEFGQAKQAASRFVKEALSPNHAAVFVSSGFQLTPFTGDGAQLAAVIDQLNARMRPQAGSKCPILTPYLAYRIANNLDQVALAAKVDEFEQCGGSAGGGSGSPFAPKPGGRQSANQPGISMDADVAVKVRQIARTVWQEQEPISRTTLDALKEAILRLSAQPAPRVLLLASSGFLTGFSLEEEQQTVISLALHANVVINSLDAKGLYTLDEPDQIPNAKGRAAIFAISQGDHAQEAGNDVLSILADSTGGRFFHNSNDLVGGYGDLATVPSVSYLLGFAPPGPPDGTFHALKLRLAGHEGYAVEARPGYFADKQNPASSIHERTIDREVFSDSAKRDAPVGINVNSEAAPGGATLLSAIFTVDVSTLPMLKHGDVRTQEVLILVALLDPQGHFVMGKEGAIYLALQPATFARLAGQRLSATLQLEATPGKYRLRVLAQEQNGGAMSAASQIVDLVDLK
jgi:VWFA-related protein